MRPAWIETQFGAFCPVCEEHVPAGSEDYDFGCGHCGYPDEQGVADYEDEQGDHFDCEWSARLQQEGERG